MENRECKIIFNAGVSRRLLKEDCKIIDIKPDKNDKNKTVFVFENNETFKKAFAKINEEITAAKKENKAE